MTDNEMKLDSLRNYRFSINEKESYLKICESTVSQADRDLIYHKLNEKNETSADDNKSECSEKKSTRELVKKIIIKTELPYDVFASTNFSFTICKRVITMKLDNENFTFLNLPNFDENFFYICINPKSNQFEIIDKLNYDLEVYKFLQIPYEIMSTFTKELNSVIKKIPIEFKTQKIKFRLRKIIKIVLVYLILLILCLVSFLQIENIFQMGKGFGYASFIIIGIYILLALYITYRFLTSKYLRYLRFKIFLSHQKSVESFIDQWCSIQKFNKQIIIPKTFQYIQFCYTNIRLFIENHEITDYI
jgi:hypothetical protein